VTDIDLNGNWQHDLPVSVSGGVGEITVNLPAEMGVRVNSDTALVSVTTSGLTKVDGGYVNDAYQTAPYALTLDLQTGIGSVILDASE
jgi:carbohydrate-binding DOMON domain-containing protein